MTKDWREAPKPWKVDYTDHDGVAWITDANDQDVIGIAVGYDYQDDSPRIVASEVLAVLVPAK